MKRYIKNISPEYKFKFDTKIFDVAGDKIKDFSCRYDYNTAVKSKRIFDSEDIPTIGKENIPNQISNIKCEINLQGLNELQKQFIKKRIIYCLNLIV